MPDFECIRKELLRNGVNKKLLWVEYCEECYLSGEEPLMYSQFCYYIQKDEEKRSATMHISRTPGEQIEVDWAGDPAYIIDPDTGEIIEAWIFVGALTYSQYAFVKAYIDQKTSNWIKAHIQMFEFFGGVTPMLHMIQNTVSYVDGKLHSGAWPKLNEFKMYVRDVVYHYVPQIRPTIEELELMD